MKQREHGYIFALPRLLARLAGWPVRRAEWSAWEVYGFGVFVFGLVCLVTGWALWPFVRPWVLVLLPLVVWLGFLFFYYVNSLVAGLLRRLGLYSGPTNNPLQHFLIMTLLTLLAGWLVAEESGWLQSLGIFWLALVALNLLALVLLKILHDP